MAGATSYEDLKTVDGVIQPSFRKAAEKRGLIEEDSSLDECLSEAAMYQMALSL
jgi:ATP-dependent DNA helicase PIF1